MSKKRAKPRFGSLPKTTLGRRIVVLFHDHSISDDSEIVCEIAGFVEQWSPRRVLIRWWTTFDEDKMLEDKHNKETSRILQGTVIKWAYAEPKKWFKVGD